MVLIWVGVRFAPILTCFMKTHILYGSYVEVPLRCWVGKLEILRYCLSRYRILLMCLLISKLLQWTFPITLHTVSDGLCRKVCSGSVVHINITCICDAMARAWMSNYYQKKHNVYYCLSMPKFLVIILAKRAHQNCNEKRIAPSFFNWSLKC